MVVFQIKANGDADTFLYEATSDTSNDVLIRDLTAVWNLRIRLRWLASGMRELALYGPMKLPEKAGLDHIDEQYRGEAVQKNEFYCEDPTGIRTGNGPGPQFADTLERVAQDAEAILDKAMAQRKIAITVGMLQEKLDNIRGAVMMAYPMGLPEWDSIRCCIEGQEMDGTAAGQMVMDPDTAELWVASRNFDRNQTIADRLGRNEKTKVIAKMQKPGAGAPGREPGVSEDERKAMMAYYFKKQEEMKQLAENQEDEFLHSSWADPKQLQRSLRGQNSNVRAPGIL
jgi:hypothetical protein